MKFCLLPLILGFAVAANAASTTVTGTVTDPDNIAWANGSITFHLVGNGGQSYFCSGTLMTPAQTTVTASLNSSGAFSTTLCPNASVTPVNTQWAITITSAATAPAQTITPTTISGSSQSLSTYINGLIKAIRIPIAFGTRAYADVEIVNPPIGGTYFNLISGVSRTWNGTTWNNSGGGSGGTSVTLENIYSGAGSFTFQHNLNSLYPQVTCYTSSSFAVWTATSVDANDTSITVPSAGTYICTFTATSAIAAAFSVSSSPSTQIYEPTMSGTQSPTFTINQSISGGYSGTASYTDSGLASGMTGVFSPTTITGAGSNTLTISFPFSQTPASTTFSVTGNDGTNSHSTSPTLTVGTINQGMVECWPMTDGTGTTFADGCGTSNIETLQTGTLTWQSTSSLPGLTPLFSATAYTTGVNQTATNFNGATPFSVSAYVNITGAATSERTIASTLDPNNNFIGWEFTIDATGGTAFHLHAFLVNDYPSNAIEVGTTTVLTTATTHRVTMAYDGSKTAAGVAFYIDGILCTNNSPVEDTLTGSLVNTKSVSLGARTDGTQPLIAGVIAYTRIYNRLLSQTDETNYTAAGAR
jgi:hypothetical protein